MIGNRVFVRACCGSVNVPRLSAQRKARGQAGLIADRKRPRSGAQPGRLDLSCARRASAPRNPLRYSGSFVLQAGAGSALPQAGAGSAEPQAGAGSAVPQAGAALGSAEPQAVPQAGAGSVVPQVPETTLSRLLIFFSF